MSDVKVKVLIADDSQVMRMLLTHLLNSDPAIEVIGTVNNGQAALNFLEARAPRPDVVLMDIHMPRMDGFEATRRIMETHPLPIVICTATADPQEVAVAFRSMEAGAVACVAKPVGPEGVDFEARTRNLLQTIRLMSEVKVIRRWARPRHTSTSGLYPALPADAPTGPPPGIKIIGMGASTGGPPVLQTILSGLSRDFPVPILIVQHIAQGFLQGMVEWLNQTTGLRIHIAAHGALALPGHAYIAPDDHHLGVSSSGRLMLADGDPENGLRPAVSYLFRSLAQTYGAAAIGVLLTGMGKDGAAELKHMKERGAWTIAQDRDSSVVHGMPGEAIALGGASRVLPAHKIAGALTLHVKRDVTTAGVNEP